MNSSVGKSSSTFASCMHRTSGWARSSQSQARSRRARIELTFQIATSTRARRNTACIRSQGAEPSQGQEAPKSPLVRTWVGGALRPLAMACAWQIGSIGLSLSHNLLTALSPAKPLTLLSTGFS